MGDGGLALGAALYIAARDAKIKNRRIPDAYFGEDHGENEMEEAIKKAGLPYERRSDIAEYAADLITGGNIVLWYQGREEYGPRALGNRSILAPAGDLKVKDKLNLEIKERDFFQPFCPSLLEEEKDKIFSDANTIDRFMTMGYMAKKEVKDDVAAVINVDGSARPQMLGGENPLYRRLISQVNKASGYGIVLNTSFNLHGFPIVSTPADAVDMMIKSKAKYLCVGPYFVENE
jgi:carbamoyltransferase